MQARPEGGDGLIGRLRCTVPDRPGPRAPARFHRTPLRGEADRPDSRWSLDADRATPHPDGGQVPAFQWADPYLPLGPGAVPLDDGDPARGRHARADPAGHPFRLVRD
ncbi:VOC family protein [Streptomyces lavendulocolor]|uniref:VOC family protein n=1 Tax=Streptomyces lavendulocolor TaxID=67316 RepID=A0ABV2W7Z7_9ACTN